MKSLLSRTALLVLALAAAISSAAAKPSDAVRNPSKVQYAIQREAMPAASLHAHGCGGSLIITSGNYVGTVVALFAFPQA